MFSVAVRVGWLVGGWARVARRAVNPGIDFQFRDFGIRKFRSRDFGIPENPGNLKKLNPGTIGNGKFQSRDPVIEIF